ncbi:bacillithiol biosynthesis deacetylase BshB2 [Aquibacillus sp. 3ASR75-11]|uniref:Bacillithiol biosynthesis deacetylase BshB2 n=1 Tax=Terrihalobacillus insolitus TaxID=2950438 RepID=A0A9X3WNQ9_9BACI|nr:bacillithiol biosynthesis deacetylase BshB2 [Terrihalobacillus insolitus]MDC3412256.1 bacillithiol biosynthesis deacetylase BshB2 [Terrihalobacillus insolitus]MDC3423050.1 bacillithiol biosynthesis deacetylase BshB2 [Terrihalobacillus insolitus]
MEKHVVVIYPHPDDEAFGASGTITKFREEGIPVTYLCGTLGEMGRNMGNPTFATRESLPEIRKKELIAACEVLDVELRMLGYRDKTLEFESKDEVAKRLRTILEEVKPSLVITHYPEHAVHPDHNALGAAAIEAVRQMNPSSRPKVWAQAISNDHLEKLGNPDICFDITPFFQKKMDTILSHRSQADGVLGKMKKDPNQDKDLEAIAKERMGVERFYTWNFES